MSVLIVMLIGFVACGPGMPGGPSVNDLIGKWKDGNGFSAEFKSDGKWTFGNRTGDSYKLKGNLLKMMKGDDVVVRRTIALSGNELLTGAFYGGNTDTLVGEWKMQTQSYYGEMKISASLKADGTGTMLVEVGGERENYLGEWKYDSSQKKLSYTITGQEESEKLYIYIVGNGFTYGDSAEDAGKYVFKKQN